MIVSRFYNENQCKNHFVTPNKRTSFNYYQSTDENSIYNELRQDSNYVCQSNSNSNLNSVGNSLIFNQSSKIITDVIKIKISDFGLARLLNNSSENMKYTSGLVTLYYRSPEILLNSNEYDESVDIWSIGCIFSEILMGFPLFQGENELDQLQKIFKILGTPCSSQSQTMNNSLFNKKYFLNTFSPKCIKEIINQVNPLVDESVLEIIDSCLKLNQKERLNSRKLLKLRFFKKEFQFLNEDF
jgi:serine/threonine protein kinase